jgi:hypothetical protein
MLHFLPGDDDTRSLVAAYRDAVAPGSHLAISHVTGSTDPAAMRILEHLYAGTADPLFGRGTEWINTLFGDFTPLAPGTRYLADWRPDPGPASQPRYRLLYGGLGVKSGQV